MTATPNEARLSGLIAEATSCMVGAGESVYESIDLCGVRVIDILERGPRLSEAVDHGVYVTMVKPYDGEEELPLTHSLHDLSLPRCTSQPLRSSLV